MSLFAEVSIVIVIATGMAVLMRLLRQPLIIGHILTGLIVGPFVFNLVHSAETFALLGEIGIAILLFTVGLHLDVDIVRRFGRVALITGASQVAIAATLAYAAATALGLDQMSAIYVAIALSLSSTIIVMKLISDKGDLDALYAKIAIGFLLVQDLIAILILVGLPIFTSGDFSFANVSRFLVSGAVLLSFVYVASRFFVSKASTFISDSQEFLFLFAVTWGIGVASLFSYFGFSLESGALVAGIALASLPARREVTARLMPLRDFFIVMFFIYLGSQMQFGDLAEALPMALTLSALVLVANPLIVMALLGLQGYRRKTSLQTGLTIAQVSEFSLIIVALGVTLGDIPQSTLSLVTLVGIITIFGSTYLVKFSEHIYALLAPTLKVFERKGAIETNASAESYSVILFGCNRIGSDFREMLTDMQEKFLVVDHDPETIERLTKQGIPAAFGDAGDWDFLNSLDLSKVQLAVSTIPSSETNLLIHRAVKAVSPEAIVMVVAHRVIDALSHYDEGIDYVILPHFLGGKYAAELVQRYRADKSRYETLRTRHIEHLKSRTSDGHEHPHHHKETL